MKKLITFIAAFIFAANAFAFLEPIADASYAIYEGGKRPGILSEPKNVTFYTFDGNSITTVKHPQAYRAYPKVNALRLDPSAPKPQPATYEIKSASKIFKSGKCTIIFYDKHDNVMGHYECYKTDSAIMITFRNPAVQPGRIGEFTSITAPSFEFLKTLMPSFPLDLSRVTEKPKISKKLK